MFGSFGIFLFALLYTLVIGVFYLPQGIGASIVALLALNSLAASFRTGDDRRLPQALLLLTALCAIALGNARGAARSAQPEILGRCAAYLGTLLPLRDLSRGSN